MEMINTRIEKKKATITKEKNNFSRVIIGSIISIILTLIILTVYASILSNTNLSEDTINTVVIVTTGVSILLGSSMSTIKIKNKGMINGGLVGLIYMLCIYLTSSLICGTFYLNSNSLIMFIVGIFTGMFGGIIGVNIKI